MRVIFFIFIILFSCQNKKKVNEITVIPKQNTIDVAETNMNSENLGQTNNDDEQKNIKLKGGYELKLIGNEEDFSVILFKGSKLIDTIEESFSDGTKISGVWEDNETTFVQTQGSGSGNPIYVFLIEKETGKNLIPEGSTIMGSTENEVLVFSENDIPDFEKDKFTIYDLKKNTSKKQNFPKELANKGIHLYEIEIKDVTQNNIKLVYQINGKEKSTIYSR